MKSSSFVCSCGALLLLSTLAGCGGSGPSVYPVKGKVTFADGTPLTKGTITFEQQATKPVSAFGQIGPDGTYSISLGEEGSGEGAPVGDYHVSIGASDDSGKSLVNQKYLNGTTSGLTAKVEAKDNNFDFKVDK